jgi:hypothetical protein
MGCASFFVVLPLALGSALAVVLVTASASAEPRPRGVGVRLEYERGSHAQQCPDELELRGEVAAGLGRDPFREAGPWRLNVHVDKRRDGAYYAVTVLSDDKGALASDLDPLFGRDCRYLVKSVLAVRISALLADPPAPPPLPPPPTPVVAPPPPDAPGAHGPDRSFASGLARRSGSLLRRESRSACLPTLGFTGRWPRSPSRGFRSRWG